MSECTRCVGAIRVYIYAIYIGPERLVVSERWSDSTSDGCYADRSQ